MSCNRAHLDGAYVLGALSPNDRRDFEEHLVSCEECSRSVRELAGLPGLLAHVSATDLEEVDPPPLPPTLLPSLVREVRAAQRRRSARVAAVAAGVAALAVGGAAVGGLFDGAERGVSATSPTSGTSTATPSPSAVPMQPVRGSQVEAGVVLASVPWGTRLDLTCTYGADEEEYEARPNRTYALVIRTQDGRVEQVATWNALPGRTMRLSAATATRQADIASVEMRTTDGQVVLRLPL